jgi:hypothetical protein
MIHWTKTSDELPECNVLLWLKSDKQVLLGIRHSDNEGWCWATHVGSFEFQGGKIVSDECELDDISPDGWAYVN